METARREPVRVRRMACGALAGSTSTLLTHPLDVVKTRMMVHDGAHHALVPRYASVGAALRTIAARKGLQALYGGLAPALVGGALSWGIYFAAYEEAKRLAVARGGAGAGAGEARRLGTGEHMACAAAAGAAVSVATNPLWVVKTRMALGAQALSAPAAALVAPARAAPAAAAAAAAATATAAGPGADVRLPRATAPRPASLRAMAAELRAIAAKEGVAGLYAGVWPSLLLVSHGSVQFAAYEQLKARAVRARGGESLPAVTVATLGAAAKLMAMACTYPLGTVRARLQQQCLGGKERAKYQRTAWQAARRIVGREGVAGLYKGSAAAAMRVVPAAATTFVVYETTMAALGDDGI